MDPLGGGSAENGVVLEAAHSVYHTPAMPVSEAGGRTVKWSVIAINSECYEVRDFVISYSYYGLDT